MDEPWVKVGIGHGAFFSVDNCCGSLPRELKVFFSNGFSIDGIPMDKAKAFFQL
jgi:hypothetical protein